VSSARIISLAFVLLLSAGIAPAIPSQRSASASAAKGRNRAGRKELDNRATQQLIQLGDGSPEYRLFIGKYHLNLEQYDAALAEFQAAAEADPKLPFVHFNLGVTYRKKQDFPRARDEFLKDELEAAVNIDNQHRAAREKHMENGTVPSPELLQDPQ
jgi:tetratricopeptide (TPR) repeat protein